MVNDELDKQEVSCMSPRLVAKGGQHEMLVAGRRTRQRTEMASSTNESLRRCVVSCDPKGDAPTCQAHLLSQPAYSCYVKQAKVLTRRKSKVP